jgi:AcrR family transcriptional regulator
MASITRPRAQLSKRRAETETAVLGAVERLLAGGERFTELSVQRIAEEAGVARSTFYLCFQDKADVLLRLTGTIKDELYAMGEKWRPVEDGPEGLAEIYLRQIRHYRERAPLMAAITEVAGYDAAFQEAGVQSIRRFTRRIASRFREEQRAGRLPAGVDPAIAGQIMAWSGEQVIARQVSIGDPADDAEVARTLAETLWYGTFRR